MKKTFKKRANNILTKFMASILIVTLSCTNFLLCGDYLVTYAAESDSKLDKQTDATLHKNVKFDSYFDNNGNKTHYKTADLNNEEPELIMSIDVQKGGYFKNASIELKNENGENELNFTITDLDDQNAIVQSVSENELVLRQINAGNDIEIKAKLAAGVNGNVRVEKLNSNSKIILKGLYIDENGKETPIEKEIEINLGWTGKYQAKIKQELIKYIPLEQTDDKKTLISMQIETGLNEEKFMLPIKETVLEIEVPTINGEKAKSVTVNAISTEATNGLTSENIKFTEENWNYSDSEGKIKINVKNDSGNIGKGTDIYVVNYLYSEKVYEELSKGKTGINAKAKVEINTYSINGDEKTIAEANDEIKIVEPVGKLISMQGENITESISKGKLYANINNPQSNDNTEYEYKWNINVGYNEGLKGIVLQDKEERMISPNNESGNLKGKTIYKQIVFNSASFEELLGEDGKVSIYNEQGRLLALVAKDSRTDKNGNYIVEFLEEVTEIKIETSKPVKNGNLVVSIKKEIKSDLGFTKTQIDNFEKINIISAISQIDEKTNEQIEVEQKEVSIPLEATVTKSKISFNKEKLSTLVTNENVEITIELGNDNETSDLYVDPIFEIELPKAIENVEILESKILFDEELLINKVEFIQKNGVPVIRVMLEGVQTKFSSGVVTNGTNVVLKTNITVNKLTPSSTEEIKMYYYNSNTVNYDNGVQTDKGLGGLATTKIDFVAPTGMITINGMTNYDGNGDIIMALNQGEILKQVETYKPARIIKMNLMAINNTGNTCSNIVMLGRIPFAGNKDIETNQDLGTTMDTYLRGYITPENIEGNGIKIYYSENGEATTNLGEETNGWTENPTDLSKIKSYMIVLEGYEMKQGEMINFTYDFEYPSNVGYNQTINANYGIYYVNNTQVATVSSFEKADTIGITTGRGPELNIVQTVEGAREDGKIEANRILKYTINISNTGTESANDVVIKNEIPKWTSLVRPIDSNSAISFSNMEEYDTSNPNSETMNDWNIIENGNGEYGSSPTVGWTIETIKPGEIITKEIYILTQSAPDIYSYYSEYPGFEVGEDGKYYIVTSKYDADSDTSTEQRNEITEVPEIDVKNVTLVSASNINAILKSSSDTVSVEDTEQEVVEEIDSERTGLVVEKENISLLVSINSQENLENVKIEKILPEGLTYVSSKILITNSETGELTTVDGKYDEATRKITIEKSDLGELKSIAAQIDVVVNRLNLSEYERIIKTNTKITYKSTNEINTPDTEIKVVKPQYTVLQESSNSSSRINTGDEIEYKLTFVNNGQVEISQMKALTYISENFYIDEILYMQYGKTTKTHSKMKGENVEQVLNIPVGGTVEILVKLKVLAVKEDTQVVTYTSISGDNVENKITDMIIQTIEQDEKYAGDNNNDNDDTNNGGNDNNQGGETGNIEKTYKVSGMAWEDTNEDGKKDETESILEGITVVAIDSTTGNIAKDKKTGEIITATTDSEGKYLLTNLSTGKYMIVFKYDSNIYTTTSYQQVNVSELYNSNAIEKEITIEGEKITAGVTDIINVDSTKSNINIGLVRKAKFDLKLDKTITKITVQNKDGVKTYNFDNSTLAKVEIPLKQLSKSMVIIEYKISVTNEGNIPGYAKNIVDYKTSDMSFNSSLNTNWYEGNDGNIYSTELENTVLNPGETKEIKLILTKQMTENNTGMVNNIAEINESYNEQGLTDKDSVAGNKAQGEDDISSADAIIQVATGGTVIYTLLAIISLAILIVGIYIIKRKISGSKEVYK